MKWIFKLFYQTQFTYLNFLRHIETTHQHISFKGLQTQNVTIEFSIELVN